MSHRVIVDHVRSADGTRLALDVLGSGPPLVLVGGAFSFRRWKGFVELAQLLADDFTVVGYDRRGRADSEPGPATSVALEMADLRAVVAHASGGPAHVFGMSSGGVLSLRAAAAGVPMRSLAVYQPPFVLGGRVPPADLAERVARLVAAGKRSKAVRLFMTRGMGAPAPAVLLMRLAPFWRDLTAVAHTLPADHAVMGETLAGRPLDPQPWRDVPVPVLVIDGGKSPAGAGAAADALAGHLPHATRLTLPGQGHNVSMPALAAAIGDFAISGRADDHRRTRP
ncbi:alpha/beta fold hydrolase [Phytohabitans houttuyneae]|uniref:Alpha/beta hydrolase n=1 Tax=Phytohabitans houttuyneae TaxID=1076126 RepID=A0A6V8KEC6_9ACTN|nr:alpha/beta hydrolase [Phytohabitans houttuyneae]GFJ83592.1 alpha/beta hydrolase [Phytohabitans houttuyneae]